MDSSQHTAFIDEAERQLRAIRNGILVSRQETQPAAIYPTAAIAALREKADRLDLIVVAAVLASVEHEFGQIFKPGSLMTETEASSMLDLVARAEAEVVKLRFVQDDRDIGSFVDASFEELIGPVDVGASGEADDAGDEFELDAEMLEIFSMEADELLANIEANLARLSASPSDRDALWEVRRHAHTFKGAAGIIGLKKPSKLAHRIEDLLDHLAQEEIVPDAQILDLIVAATDCLRAITRGDNTPGIAERTSTVYQAFDKLMANLAAGPLPAESVPAEVTQEAPREVPNSPSAEPTTQRRPIVRVSISRLDNLVRVVRDLVVSRSAVEQRLAALEAHLDALGKTTRRLQSAHAKIENDFEASMLRSFVPSQVFRPGAFAGSGEVANDGSTSERFDALEFDSYTDFHESTRDLSEAIQDCFSIGTSLEAIKASLDTVIDDQRRLIEETQEKVMQIRLIKFESLATRLERAVRVTCDEEHKSAEVVLENPHIELDTDILDSLVEPLIHLIRNAVVHGIETPETRRLLGKPETGRITIRVADQETHIELKVSDDGRGIDTVALRSRAVETGMLDGNDADLSSDLMHLLTLPGLTTAEKLTMSAGRGVGMGIVKESVAARGGTLSVETALQLGTSFTIKVPLAFAVTQALLVRSDRRLAAVPFKVVKRIMEVLPADVRDDGTNTTLETPSGLHTLYQLGDLFANQSRETAGPLNVLLIETDSERFALVVDEILKTEEVAVKPLGKPLDRIAGVLGAAVLGNGEVAPVLDVSYFANSRPRMRPAKPAKPEPVEKKTIVLVVDDSPSVRHMTSKAVAAAGWSALAAKDGIEALEILEGGQLPDIILTDVEMPRMDGYELAAALRSHETFCDIPLVFITSRAGEKHREKAAELGVKEYLTKPFLDGELIDTVERLTDPAVRA